MKHDLYYALMFPALVIMLFATAITTIAECVVETVSFQERINESTKRVARQAESRRKLRSMRQA